MRSLDIFATERHATGQEGRAAEVGRSIHQRAPRRLTVSARAPDFLVVTLQVRRNVAVDHEPDVGLVDAEAEGIRRRDHA